ncbi:MAG: methylenetetrahydrofolate--tRNA-(uracil(54)-C(5))-methyltransferase (FADH(2)-oxidizing) TrmFO, partial [Clostridia bacterium]
MLTADKTQVPAGGALAVDREKYAKAVTDKLKKMPNINVINEEVTDLNALDGITVVATGPLTSDGLQEFLKNEISDFMYFYDAASPIVTAESIDYEKSFFGDRYGKGDADYLNCPMSKSEYLEFYNELINAECVILKDFEKKDVFEGCMPIEIMAKRGVDTMCFGTLKPVGLSQDGEKHHAVLQLRYENEERTLFNLVGFQTNLKFSEQKRVFSLIPALKNAEYVRYGVMHRNTFVNAPKVLNLGCQFKKNLNIFFAGQITGVEGYVESAMSGLYTALQIDHLLKFGNLLKINSKTMMGSLINYISKENAKFQPMNANFGIVDALEINIGVRNKIDRYKSIADLALQETEKNIKKFEGEQDVD